MGAALHRCTPARWGGGVAVYMGIALFVYACAALHHIGKVAVVAGGHAIIYMGAALWMGYASP